VTEPQPRVRRDGVIEAPRRGSRPRQIAPPPALAGCPGHDPRRI